MTGIIIQARKGSSRLPNKMVLPFYDEKGVLEILLEKLNTSITSYKIILATTTNRIDDELVEIANKYKISFYRGSESNVLNRFIDTAEHFGIRNIIRICADNPFLNIPHIEDLIRRIENNEFDYISYRTKTGLPIIKTHLGLYTEAVTLAALKKIKSLTDDPFYFEHVTNFIYENKDMFYLEFLDLPAFMNNTELIRLTLDTEEDFEMERKLFNIVKTFSTEELIMYVKRDKNLMERMSVQIKLNSK